MANALLKRARDALKKIDQSGIGHVEDESLKKERELCESSFYEFTKRAWRFAGSGADFIETWHIFALCEHLEECYNGKIKNFVINIPPRCGKSTVLNVLFPAWVWAKDPSLKFIFGSHSERLSIRDSDYCRALIKSEWYQGLWGKKFQLTNDTSTKFNNNKTGYRIALSIGSKMTGEGADFLVWDDPNNRDDVHSAIIREGTNETWDLTMSTRWINPHRFCRIVSQQRLHEYDLSGHILSANKNVVHFCLPYEYELSRKCKTIPLLSTNGKPWTDPRRKEGELLWPSQINAEKIKELKVALGAYEYANQFQQRGSPADGGIFKKEWFQWWSEPQIPDLEFIIQSWDTALSTEADAAYSCCTTWGVFKDRFNVANAILLNMWRGRVEMPELREMAQRLANNYHDVILEDPAGPGPTPDIILVEAKANGLSLIQYLQRAGVPVTRFDPMKYRAFGQTHNNKVQRARLISSHVEAGRIWLPAKPPHFRELRGYSDKFLSDCISFPNGESCDTVDSFSQAMIKLISSGWINHPTDEEYVQKVDIYQDRPIY
jgi:predicted phage terminase large subunit-like protein